jgi:ATP-dependent exoDNAse (exonuclease V) beta subunit
MDGYSVVWWDPGILDLGRKPAFGVRREDLIVKDVGKDVIAHGRSRYDGWLLARAAARESGAVPSVNVQTVRERVETAEAAHALPADGGPMSGSTLQTLDLRDHASPERSAGVGFGLLVHELLAQASFDATADDLAALAAVNARVLALPEADGLAAARAVHRVLQHSLLKRARDADARGACRRETPLTLTTADGVLVEGVVDLAFEERGRWTIVDYKTDRELLTIGEARYRQQVALYASAISDATGQPAEGLLLRI